MEGFDLIQEFFCTMHCSKCQSPFTPDGITLVREESNYYVVKIMCTECNQPVGIAIVGLGPKLRERSKASEGETKSYSTPKKEYAPITYDDVIDAHDFFSNLGSDWTKHIQDSNRGRTEDLE